VLHTLQADHAPSEFFDLSGFPMDNEDLQTRIVIEMSVTRRNHQIVMRMLEFGKFLGYAMGVVVVD
jgi:hypothetical protein